MHAHADVARLQLLDELIAGNRQALRHDAQHIQMAAVVAVIRRLLQAQLRHIRKRPLVNVHRLEAAALHIRHAAKLGQRQRSLNVEHVVFVARLLDVVAPGAFLAVAVPRARAHAVAGEHLRLGGDFVVVRHQRAALAAGQIFGRVEGIAHRAARMMADQFAVVAGFNRVRRILAEEQVVRVADLADCAQIRREAGIMHRHHRARPVRDLLFDFSGVDEPRIRVDIRKHRRRADVQNRVRRGGKRQRRGNHLVAGADPLRQQRQMQRRRAGIDRDAVLRADIFRKLLLKLHRARALRPPAGTDYIRIRLHLGLGNIRQTKGHPVRPHAKFAHAVPPAPIRASFMLKDCFLWGTPFFPEL